MLPKIPLSPGAIKSDDQRAAEVERENKISGNQQAKAKAVNTLVADTTLKMKVVGFQISVLDGVQLSSDYGDGAPKPNR